MNDALETLAMQIGFFLAVFGAAKIVTMMH